jgi:hypothetical protein
MSGYPTETQSAPGHDVLANRVVTESRFTCVAFNAASVGTLLKTGPGVLKSLRINQGVASGTIALFDGTSAAGTPIVHTTDVPATIAQGTVLAEDIQFSIGLFVVIVGAVRGNVTFR